MQALASSTSHETETSRPQSSRGLNQPIRRVWLRHYVCISETTELYEAKDHRTQENQEQSPFLKLPLEIRNKIYAYAFDSATARPADWRFCNNISKVIEDAESLFLTYRQTRQEAQGFTNPLANASRKSRRMKTLCSGIAGTPPDAVMFGPSRRKKASPHFPESQRLKIRPYHGIKAA